MNVLSTQLAGKTSPSAPRAKFPKEAVRPYAQVIHDILLDRRLADRDTRLAGILLIYAKDKAHCWPSIRTLAADLSCSERSVQYALKHLTATGWIETKLDSNPTGRVIILLWRSVGSTVHAPGAKPCTPPVQPSVVHPVQAVAPELDSKPREKKGCVASDLKPVRPSGNTRGEPMAVSEHLETFAEWLSRPPGDRLRMMAERRLTEMLASSSHPQVSERSKHITLPLG